MVSLCILILLLGCNSAESDWEEASRTDTITAYLEYIEQYPESEQKENAIQRLLTKALPESFNLISKQNFSEAKSLLEIVLKVDPTNPFALNNLAVILTKEGAIEKARIFLKSAIPRAKEQLINNIVYDICLRNGSKLIRLLVFQSDTSNTCHNWDIIKDCITIDRFALFEGEGVCACLYDPGPNKNRDQANDQLIFLDMGINYNISRLEER
jgi:tetratricopeptide (TPR) repeat protein